MSGGLVNLRAAVKTIRQLEGGRGPPAAALLINTSEEARVAVPAQIAASPIACAHAPSRLSHSHHHML